LAGLPIPDKERSTVEREGYGSPACNPDVAVVCPRSDLGGVNVTVTVIDLFGDPMGMASVICWPEEIIGDFCWCPGESLQTGITNMEGQAFFDFTDFGGCGDVQFVAECMGVEFYPSPTIFIASTDTNADCKVDAIDFSGFAQAYGGSNHCFDYDCSGQVGAVDFSVFAQHYGHDCFPSE
jgi:hypothetical protein